MRVLVTGSSGFVGHHLVPRLRDEVDEVFALRRGGSSALLPPGVTPVDAPEDLAMVEEGAPWPDGIDLVIHLAASNPIRGTAGAGDTAALTRANAEGTAALARRASESGIPRFLYLSTANGHRPRGLDPVIEEDECDPVDAYAASKHAGELALQDLLPGTGTRYTILRPAPVYGHGGRGVVASLQTLAARGVPLPFAGLKARRSVLAVDNLVDAILLARAHPMARDEVFLIADDDPPTLSELVEMMRAAIDRPSRQFKVPPALLRATLRALGKREMAARMSEFFVVDTSKIRLRLGWRPRLATREALSASAAIDAHARERSAR